MHVVFGTSTEILDCVAKRAVGLQLFFQNKMPMFEFLILLISGYQDSVFQKEETDIKTQFLSACTFVF